MHVITIYQKPSCSTCKQTMEMLREKGVQFDAINYYIDPIDKATIKSLLGKLQIPAIELFRKKEAKFKELGLAEGDLSEEELIEVLAQNPDLIQRPIVVRGDKAVLGRPPENINMLF